MPLKILILGGTSLARQLAEVLESSSYEVVLSLAGVTSAPHLPRGKIQFRAGGFGGSEGLARYITETKISVVVDATHPFAAAMGQQIFEATQTLGVICYRLADPPWRAQPGDRWQMVKNFAAAAALVPLGARVFLSIGHKGLACFLERSDLGGVIRLIEPMPEPLPQALAALWQVILERGPFTVDSENELLQQNRISHLVTKNSGTAETAAKLAAARALGLEVMMIERPLRPDIPAYSLIELVTLLSELADA